MKRRRRHSPSPGALGSFALAPLRFGVALVLLAFFLPWVEYQETLGAGRFGVAPPDERIPGWRIPIFIDEARGFAATKAAEIIRGAPIDGALTWLVYLSPLTALSGLFRLRRRSAILDMLYATASAVVVFFLALRGSAIAHISPPFGLTIRPDFGLWTALFGHAVAAAASVRIAFARFET